MALIVEDGTGKADAESYIGVADATAYHSNRGNAAWAALASDTVREQMLRKATDYMLGIFRDRWLGFRMTSTQALDWPRQTVPMTDTAIGGEYLAYYANNIVPAQVSRACAELALRAIDGALNADLDPPVIEEAVGPIITKYAHGARQGKAYPAIEAMLASLLQGSDGILKVSRA
jgi:hypothetical protein